MQNVTPVGDASGKVRCDACPVTCFIKPATAGACDRYANLDGELVRVDPHIMLRKTLDRGGECVPFIADEWDGSVLRESEIVVTAIGAGTTYPEYKPAPLIVSSVIDGVDMVTVVTEGIFSYCGVKLKIDTDRHLGHEMATVLSQGEPVGHVTTGEYGSQMLSLGGVNHLTGGSKKGGRATCDAILSLCNGDAVELSVAGGSTVIVEAGRAPIVNGVVEARMRAGCGSATIGMFAKQWHGLVDEVVVIDDHITGVLSEHQAGKMLGIPSTGIKIKGRRSTPGRYFQVAEPGQGWGGTSILNPLDIIGSFDPKQAWPGLRMLAVSTTGEQWSYFELDEALTPQPKGLPQEIAPSIERISENCEPGMCSVMFIAGAGGSLRSGVVENPVNLTNAVKNKSVEVTCGGAPVFLWPGGGVTFMVDVSRMPKKAFGYVPTPAIVAPIEFTMKHSLYAELGGHLDAVRPLSSLRRERRQ
jgi:hypothetical protein